MATDSFINQLMEERDQKVSIIENLASVAADEGRDLHETDLATIQNYRSRISIIDNQIEKVAGDLELADSVKSRVRNLDPSVVAREFSYRSAGEYLFDAFNQRSDANASARWQKFHRRAAQHMGYDKDNTVPTAGGFNGLVVDPVVGAVLNPTPGGRPFFTALGVNPMTSGAFLRPRIVDPNFLTGVAPQGQEKAELASKAWEIVSDQVKGTVVGGYINISYLVDSLIPSGYDMIVAQMNRRLEAYTERAAVDEMNNTTATVAAADGTSAGITAAVGEASALVFRNTGSLPTWMAMGPDGWGNLIGISDLAGRPMIPAVGPVNAWGANGGGDTFVTGFAGMRVVVSYAIDGTDIFIGNSFGLEVYERRLPVLNAVEPSVFGHQLSVQSMIGFYRPVTAEAGAGNVPPAESNGVVKITIP